MKKIGLFILLIGMILLPISVKAAEKYNTLSFEEALADEEIEKDFKEHKPNSDAITIYLFRGKGCGYCRAFLTFMNSITEEYGKYFKIETYEVWNDQANSTLLGEVSSYLGESAGGVPYIVIGDKVFPGYAEQYNDGIKEAIKTLYDTKKSKRYDVFNEMKKHPKKKDSSSGISDKSVIIWSLIFTVFAMAIIISYNSLKFKELNLKIEELMNAKHYSKTEDNIGNEKKTAKKSKK